MNAPEPLAHDSFAAQLARAREPFPASRKAYLPGQLRQDLRVPVRDIQLTNGEVVSVYDTSGPYTDPQAVIDVRRGLPSVRGSWIAARGDTEAYAGRPPVALDDGQKSEDAARLAQLGAEGIDLNFGCPAKVVNRAMDAARWFSWASGREASYLVLNSAVMVESPVGGGLIQPRVAARRTIQQVRIRSGLDPAGQEGLKLIQPLARNVLKGAGFQQGGENDLQRLGPGLGTIDEFQSLAGQGQNPGRRLVQIAAQVVENPGRRVRSAHHSSPRTVVSFCFSLRSGAYATTFLSYLFQLDTDGLEAEDK